MNIKKIYYLLIISAFLLSAAAIYAQDDSAASDIKKEMKESKEATGTDKTANQDSAPQQENTQNDQTPQETPAQEQPATEPAPQETPDENVAVEAKAPAQPETQAAPENTPAPAEPAVTPAETAPVPTETAATAEPPKEETESEEKTDVVMGKLLEQQVSGGTPGVTATAPIPLGKESDEVDAPFELFRTPEDVQKLLMKETKFVYNPKRLPDPMIIPWVRDQLLAKEKLDKAKQYFEWKRFDDVMNICQDITVNHKKSTGIIKQAEELRQKAIFEIKKGTSATGPTTPGIDEGAIKDIPPSVREGLKGILFSDKNPKALIGEDILSVGDEVPFAEGVFIEEIKKSGEVVFRFNGVLFPVTVKTTP